MRIECGRTSRPFIAGPVLKVVAALAIGLGLTAIDTRASVAQLAPEAAQAMEKMYGGDPDGAIAMLHTYEAGHPDDPLPFTIEAEARWWKMYCDASDIKWGLFDSQKRGKKPEDESYFTLADHVIQLTSTNITMMVKKSGL